MAHPMFKIDDELQRFPLIDRALDETWSQIEGALFWTIGEMPLIALPKQIIETVDKGIVGTDAQKQAIIICALYIVAPAALAAGQGNFARDYDDETAAVLDALASYDKADVMPAGVARAHLALAVPLLGAMTDMLAESGQVFPASQVNDLRAQQEAQDKLLLPLADAPKLEALYHAAVDRQFDVASGIVSAVTPKRPKPGALRP